MVTSILKKLRFNEFPAVRRLLMATLLCAFTMGLGACGKSDGTMVLTVSGQLAPSGSTPQTPAQGPQSLFKVWTESGNTFQINLTQCAFNQTKIASVQTITGETCSCQALVQGSNTTGTITFSSCTSATCNNFAGTFQYTNSQTGLQACQGATCLTFR